MKDLDDQGHLENPSGSANAEMIFKAAGFWWERFDKRSQVVWRIHLSLWTAIAALIGIIVTGRIPWQTNYFTYGCIGFSIMMLIFSFVYIKGQARMNRLDRDQFQHYYEKFQQKPRLKYPEELENEIQKAINQSVKFRHYANFHILAITAVLAFALVLASWAASSKSPASYTTERLGTSEQTKPIKKDSSVINISSDPIRQIENENSE